MHLAMGFGGIPSADVTLPQVKCATFWGVFYCITGQLCMGVVKPCDHFVLQATGITLSPYSGHMHAYSAVHCSTTSAEGTSNPPPRVGKPGGRRVGERVGDRFYPIWRAGSIFWRSAQNKAYYAVFAVQVSVHFARHSSISAAPNIWFLATSPNFADSLGPSPTRGGGCTRGT